MLNEFLTNNAAELIAMCKAKVGKRPVPPAQNAALQHGIPLFLEQLISTLRSKQTSTPGHDRSAAVSPLPQEAGSEMGPSALLHGGVLQGQGFSVDQVVHDYGDLCQAITELAIRKGMPITNEEFQCLNFSLDNAIADAVSQFERQSMVAARAEENEASNQRLGYFAHELRNLIQTATLAAEAIRSGRVGATGATAGVLDRSLKGLAALIDVSLAEVRLTAKLPVLLP